MMWEPGMTEPPSTLFALLKAERQQLIERWSGQIRAALAAEPVPNAELIDHVPLFVDDLVGALYPEAMPFPGPSQHAVAHGAQRLRLGFDVGEVVREYGILHLCILQLAREAGLAIDLREQEVVARWLNTGIADAVSQYVSHRDLELQRQGSEHVGFIAHELRNPLSTAQLAFQRLRGPRPAGDRVLAILERSLRRAAEVVDSALTHAWLKMGVALRPDRLPLREFLEEIGADAGAEADGKGIHVEVSVEADLEVHGDPRLLRSAVANLLLNAVKFSRPGGAVSMTAWQREGRVLIEIADSCGGLPAGRVDELFAPLVQRGEDRTGFGLGLAIAMQAAEAHHGTIKVRDVPGRGCVFTVDLPGPVRHT
jgi:signal transduction histidine kinase